MRARAATVALVASLAAPASAALLRYDFTAGGEGVDGFANDYNHATGVETRDANNFLLSASFVIDTAMMKQAAEHLAVPNDVSIYDNYGGGQPFMTSTVLKTGGDVALPPLPVLSRSYFYADSDDTMFPDESFQFYQSHEIAGVGGQPRDEYRTDGSLARRTYDNSRVTVSFAMWGDLIDLGFMDDVQVVTGFNSLDRSGGHGYIQVSRYFFEYLFDETGQVTSQTIINTFASAQLTSASVTDITADVPEPAALSIFGLGLIGLAIQRRRQA